MPVRAVWSPARAKGTGTPYRVVYTAAENLSKWIPLSKMDTPSAPPVWRIALTVPRSVHEPRPRLHLAEGDLYVPQTASAYRECRS